MGSTSLLNNLQVNNLTTQNLIVGNNHSSILKIINVLKPGKYKLYEETFGYNNYEADVFIEYDIVNKSCIVNIYYLNHPIIQEKGLFRVVKFTEDTNNNIIYESKSYDKFKNILSSRSGLINNSNINDLNFTFGFTGYRVITNSIYRNVNYLVKRENNKVLTELYENQKYVLKQEFIQLED